MSDFTIISYYTKNTPYEEVYYNYLLPSLEKFKLRFYVKEITSLGSWYKNTAYKAKFILESLEKLNTNVVYVDVDAKILKYPKLFKEIPEEYDLALHHLSWRLFYGYKNSKEEELLTGTIFARPNNKVKEICQLWYEEAIKTNEWEQKVLARILGKRQDIKVFELPVEYCMLHSRPRNQPLLIDDSKAVIKHFQKSRIYRRIIR